MLQRNFVAEVYLWYIIEAAIKNFDRKDVS